MSQENEKRLQDELNRIKEDIKSEKASAQAARLLEKQKREKLIKNEVLLFRQQHEEINKHINSLMAAISQLPKVNVEINGKHFGRLDYFVFKFHCLANTQYHEVSLMYIQDFPSLKRKVMCGGAGAVVKISASHAVMRSPVQSPAWSRIEYLGDFSHYI